MGTEFYGVIWQEIRRRAPAAVLLRGPSGLDPHYPGRGGDLDILLPTDWACVTEFLEEMGFRREYAPESYRTVYRCRRCQEPESYTVDLYRAQLWSAGFLARTQSADLIEPSLAYLLRAVFDGKGVRYLESYRAVLEGSPIWGRVDGNRLARFALQRDHLRFLGLSLWSIGLVRPQWSSILRTFGWRFAWALCLLTRKRGVEVGLIGVDGSGKSTVAATLRRLPLPAVVIYMGHSKSTTWLMRMADRVRFPPPLSFLAAHCEMFSRRLRGRLLAQRGWVVIYDRHPIERFGGSTPVKRFINDLLVQSYAWPTDLMFWLTGSYQEMLTRKGEHTVDELERMDQLLHQTLTGRAVPFVRVNTTNQELHHVVRTIGDTVFALYRDRLSIDRQRGWPARLLGSRGE